MKTKKSTKKKTKTIKKSTRSSGRKKRGCSICGKPGVDRRTHPHKNKA